MAATGSGWGKTTENQKNHATFNTGDTNFGDDQPQFAGGVPTYWYMYDTYPFGPNGVPHHPPKLRYYHTNIMPMSYCASWKGCQNEEADCGFACTQPAPPGSRPGPRLLLRPSMAHKRSRAARGLAFPKWLTG